MKKEIAHRYIDFLVKGQPRKIIELFHEDGLVFSPLYGKMLAKDFYIRLQEDTESSDITCKEVFENQVTGNIALYFEYHWVLKSGKKVSFDVVDIVEFNDDLKIISLKIIYDTVLSRKLLEELK